MEFGIESEQGAFNAGIEYLKTLVAIERQIDMAFLEDDFKKVDRLLDIFWIELSEWMKDDEKKEHDLYRKKEKEAYNFIKDSIKKKVVSVPSNIMEPFIERYQALKRLVHKKGLRMPKKDDPAFAMSGRQY